MIKKIIASALLMFSASLIKAEITGLYTFPGGSNGDVQIYEDGYFGGRTLTAGSNVTITTNSTQITISATGGGGGASSLEVFSNYFGTRSTPTASISITGGLSLTVTGSTAVVNAVSNSTSIANGLGTAINVKAYGAVGDGVTNDRTAILNALAAGSHIYFPPGNYFVSDSIILNTSYSGYIIEGAGASETSGVGTRLTSNTTNQLFLSSGTTSLNYLTIKNMALYHNGSAGGDLIQIEDSANFITISNIVFSLSNSASKFIDATSPVFSFLNIENIRGYMATGATVPAISVITTPYQSFSSLFSDIMINSNDTATAPIIYMEQQSSTVGGYHKFERVICEVPDGGCIETRSLGNLVFENVNTADTVSASAPGIYIASSTASGALPTTDITFIGCVLTGGTTTHPDLKIQATNGQDSIALINSRVSILASTSAPVVQIGGSYGTNLVGDTRLMKINHEGSGGLVLVPRDPIPFIQLKSTDSAQATCLGVDSDRLYADLDCNASKGGSEQYLDEAPGSGGSGSGTSIRVEDGGSFVVTSSTMDFDGNQFSVTNNSGEALVALNSSSVTLKGNTFNTGSGLVELSGSLIPNSLVDGSSITKQGLLVAGSNVTLTPGVGTLTIAATSGSGDIESVTAGPGLSGGGTIGAVTLSLDPNATHYIHNQNTLQSGATFYVSSGTINGDLLIWEQYTPFSRRGILNIRNVPCGAGDACGEFIWDGPDSGGSDGLLIGTSNGDGTNAGIVFRQYAGNRKIYFSASTVDAQFGEAFSPFYADMDSNSTIINSTMGFIAANEFQYTGERLIVAVGSHESDGAKILNAVVENCPAGTCDGTYTSNFLVDKSTITANVVTVFNSSMTLSGAVLVKNVAPTLNQVLKYDGTNWAPATDETGGGGGGTTIWGQDDEAVVSNAVSTITVNGVLKSTVTATNKMAVFLNYDTNQFSNQASTFTADTSSFTMYGPNIPASAISDGSLGASVLASSIAASGVSSGYFPNANVTVNPQGQITTISTGTFPTSVGVRFYNGGSALSAGATAYVQVPTTFTVTSWSIYSQNSCSASVVVLNDTEANFPPTLSDAISGTEKPSLAAQTLNTDTNLTTWTTTEILKKSFLAFYLESVSTCTDFSAQLFGTGR